MIIDCKGKYGKFLILGVQTNKGNTQEASIKLAKSWCPEKAKSFNMSITNTDYEGRSASEETGYANIKVTYFTTEKEGKYLI